MRIILLSGGSGSRLWPLSNGVRSKQFLKVLRDPKGNPCSMVQRVFSQIADAGYGDSVTIATSESQVPPLQLQIPSERYTLAVEPERRDTMPAILLACANLADGGVSDDETVLVSPIDSYVDDDYFQTFSKLDKAVQDDFANVVLRGVVPTFPSMKYGYIVPEPGQATDGPQRVARFVEKPGQTVAENLISKGALWNCGVFSFKLGFALSLIESMGLPASYDELRALYAELPKTSFDYGVLEKCDSIGVVPYEGSWTDLGTWNTLCDEMTDKVAGRVVCGEGCRNVHVVNELNTPLVALGLKDVVIAATPDGILVSDKQASAQNKKYVEQVSETRPMHEARKWGHYTVLGHHDYIDGSKAIVKTLHLDAGKRLSYQMHTERAEVWTIVSGRGVLTLDDVKTDVVTGDVIKVEVGQKHRIEADPESDLIIIEVQLGANLIEEDIIRFPD